MKYLIPNIFLYLLSIKLWFTFSDDFRSISPPITYSDYAFSLGEDEGICDLFDIPKPNSAS